MRPWDLAFRDAAAFPARLRGPVLFFALARFAFFWRSVTTENDVLRRIQCVAFRQKQERLVLRHHPTAPFFQLDHPAVQGFATGFRARFIACLLQMGESSV